jgi:excisionase family DNA binding protein
LSGFVPTVVAYGNWLKGVVTMIAREFVAGVEDVETFNLGGRIFLWSSLLGEIPRVTAVNRPSINSIHQEFVDETLVEVIRKAVREELQAVIEQNGKRGGFRMDPATENTPELKPYLTIKEAADLVRLAPPTIRLYIRKRGLRAHKVGRRVIIKREELIAFLEQKQARGAAI